MRGGELAGLKLTDIDSERVTVNQSVWNGQTQSPKTDSALRTLGLSPQLITLLWEQIARQKAKEHEFLFTSQNGTPWDMNVHRRRKLTVTLTALEVPQAGYHAFRHFNVALQDALRVPLKTIQERLGHSLTGSFTLDVYGGTPEFERNLEAARMLGAEIERAVAKAVADVEAKQTEHRPTVSAEQESELIGSLSAIQQKGSGARIS